MLETSARLLRLLSLLQTPRDWTGADLAERLEVDAAHRPPRRRPAARPRLPGRRPTRAWPATGSAPAPTLPPLLLDDEEAVAVASACARAAGGTVAGIEETLAARAGQAGAGAAVPAAPPGQRSAVGHRADGRRRPAPSTRAR